MPDPFATQMNRLEQAVLFEPEALASQVRQAAATAGEVPEVMRTSCEDRHVCLQSDR